MSLVESLEVSFSQTHENGLVSQPLLPSGSEGLAGHRQHPPGRYSEMPGRFLRIHEIGQRSA